jgi:hypothetical protein
VNADVAAMLKRQAAALRTTVNNLVSKNYSLF